MIKTVAVIALLVLIGFGAFLRLNPLDEKFLHVDPDIAKRPSAPGHFLVREGGDVEPPTVQTSSAELAVRLEAIILETPGTSRLAGNLDDGWASYVTRSRIWGFPDIASIKLVETEVGTSVRVFSRLLYGYADFGVNRGRVESWLSQL